MPETSRRIGSSGEASHVAAGTAIGREMKTDYEAGSLNLTAAVAMGTGVMIGACALLMASSMIINESLVARTFGAYTLQLFDVEGGWPVSRSPSSHTRALRRLPAAAAN